MKPTIKLPLGNLASYCRLQGVSVIHQTMADKHYAGIFMPSQLIICIIASSEELAKFVWIHELAHATELKAFGNNLGGRESEIIATQINIWMLTKFKSIKVEDSLVDVERKYPIQFKKNPKISKKEVRKRIRVIKKIFSSHFRERKFKKVKVKRLTHLHGII